MNNVEKLVSKDGLLEESKLQNSNNVWDRVSENFGGSGPKYWDWFGQKLVEAATIEDGQNVLDIGFGRGASLFPALEAVGKTGRVIGLEASFGMVHHTEKVLKEKNILNCTLQHVKVDTFNHSTTYDVILNGFGLGYLLEDGLLEQLRNQLNNQGKVCLTSWTHQHDQDWLTGLVNKHLNITSTHEESPLSTIEGVRSLLAETHFSDINIQLIHKTVTFKDEEAWWHDMMNCAVRNIIDAITKDADIKAFKEEAFIGLRQFKDDQGIHFKREVMLIVCKK